MLENQPQKSILIVEDDETLQQTLAYNLEREGYAISMAADGQTALKVARLYTYDLIILDIMLPELDGLSVCRVLRRELDVPIIILSARSSEVDKIVGLDSGANDYITKPFSLGEFLARVRVALRRKPQLNNVEYLISGDLSLDLFARKAYKDQKELDLSFKEFDLLAELIRSRGTVLSRGFLLTKVWGYDYYGESRTVDVHIRWLREKIEEEPSTPKRIITIRSLGYRFEG